MIPSLFAQPTAHGLRVWCPHCRQAHYHGGTYGHRVAHCTRPGSPYQHTGYELVAAGTAGYPIQNAAELVARYRRQP